MLFNKKKEDKKCTNVEELITDIRDTESKKFKRNATLCKIIGGVEAAAGGATIGCSIGLTMSNTDATNLEKFTALCAGTAAGTLLIGDGIRCMNYGEHYTSKAKNFMKFTDALLELNTRFNNEKVSEVNVADDQYSEEVEVTSEDDGSYNKEEEA